MKKEDIILLLQLLQTMKEISSKIEEYYNKGDTDRFNSAKKELLGLQTRVRDLL